MPKLKPTDPQYTDPCALCDDGDRWYGPVVFVCGCGRRVCAECIGDKGAECERCEYNRDNAIREGTPETPFVPGTMLGGMLE